MDWPMVHTQCVIDDDAQGGLFISPTDSSTYSSLDLSHPSGIHYILDRQNANMLPYITKAWLSLTARTHCQVPSESSEPQIWPKQTMIWETSPQASS